jgi:hypothetical protein
MFEDLNDEAFYEHLIEQFELRGERDLPFWIAEMY